MIGYVLSIFIAGAGAALMIYIFDVSGHVHLVMAVSIFFLVGSPLSYYISQRLIRRTQPAAFTMYSLLLTTVKLMAGIMIIVIYSELHPDMDVVWVWPYLYVYLVFTIFDVRTMMIHSKDFPS